MFLSLTTSPLQYSWCTIHNPVRMTKSASQQHIFEWTSLLALAFSISYKTARTSHIVAIYWLSCFRFICGRTHARHQSCVKRRNSSDMNAIYKEKYTQKTMVHSRYLQCIHIKHRNHFDIGNDVTSTPQLSDHVNYYFINSHKCGIQRARKYKILYIRHMAHTPRISQSLELHVHSHGAVLR